MTNVIKTRTYMPKPSFTFVWVDNTPVGETNISKQDVSVELHENGTWLETFDHVFDALEAIENGYAA